jgi:hypothetical protein
MCHLTIATAYSTDAHHLSLSSSSLPCRNHQPFRLAIFSLRPELRDVEEMSAMRGDKKAAKKFLRRLLKTLLYVLRVIITDKLRSYGAEPTRLRERLMRRFKSAGLAQHFLSAFGIITSHFRVGRHLYRASAYRAVMQSRFAIWEKAICIEAIVIDPDDERRFILSDSLSCFFLS